MMLTMVLLHSHRIRCVKKRLTHSHILLCCDLDVQMLSGFKNVMFGGEGLFITTLTGPGTVWLQGQPPQRMVSEIARRVPSGGIGVGIPIGMGGGGGEGGDGGGEPEK
jgi:Mitochondrial biogenesis AIM24